MVKKPVKKKAVRQLRTSKKAAEEISKPLAPSKKKQRYVALRNIDRRKAEGWKEVAKPKDAHGRELGVRTHCEDLVLMEK